MGKQLVTTLRGTNPQLKKGALLLLAFLASFAYVLLPQGVQAATVTYGLHTDAATALGIDGTCNMTQTVAPTAKTTMVNPATTAATSYRPTTGMTTGTAVTLVRAYGPVYTTAQTITAPAGSFAIRGYNATDTWTFHIYSYNPAGTANNKTLMFSSNTITSGTGATVTAVPTYTVVNSSMPANNRLLVEIVYTPGGATLTPRIYLDGTTAAAMSTVTVTETANTDTTPPTDGAAAATATASSSTQIALAWPAATDAGVGLHATLPYIVKYNLGATAPAANCTNGTQIYNGTALTYTHSSLLAGTQYSYRICAQDANSNVSTGKTATATTVTSSGTTSTYTFTTSSGTALGIDGSTNQTQTVAPTARTLMQATATTAATSYRPTTGMTSGTETILMRVYGPVYAAAQTLSSPSGSFAIRGYNATDAWKFHIYKYNPAGTANNKTLMFSSSTIVSGTGATVAAVPTYTQVDNAMPAGWRLLVEVSYTPGGATLTPRIYIDGTAATSRCTVAVTETPVGGVTLTSGSAIANASVYAGDTSVAVDAFAMQASGTETVSAIQVTGSAASNNTNISALRIYRKVGTNLTAYEASDVAIASVANPFASGTVATVAVTETVTTAKNYLIVYDIAATAVPGSVLTGNVTAITSTNGSSVSDATGSATLTVYPTTTLATGSEPATSRLWKGSAATLMDAFTLGHNGTAANNDTISNVTVTMTPQYISGGSGGTLSKIKLLEIVDATGSIVYGSLNLPTTGDTWNIPTTSLVATPTTTVYYVRASTADAITPSTADTSGTATGFYAFGGTVTAALHSVGTSKLVLADTASQTLSIDVEKPVGPATVTATTGTAGGTIDLVWDAATDGNGGSLHPVKPYIIKRSQPEGVTPAAGCTDGTDLSTVPGLTIDYANRRLTDIGLVDTTATRYYYRVCAQDALGNINDGATSYANSKITPICWNPPTISLTAEDGLETMQLIKSANSTPFKLQINNNDIGTCPDVTFTLSLANEVNSAHFNKMVEASNFPAQVTLGTGGVGARTGITLNVYITGRPEASQLEQYKFAVTVSSPGNSHGAPITTAQNTGVLNDMPPIVHNSNNMAKYQYGNWGQTYTCATCHSNSTTNIKGIYTIISTPIGRRNVVFTKTSSSVADSVGVYSNDQRAVKNVSNNICSVCHHRTRQHQYSANKTLAGPSADEAYNSEHNNSKDCVACHTHNSAFRSIYGKCGDCHGYKATGYSPVNKATMVKELTNALGPTPTNYGAHQRHYRAALGCGACHNNGNHAFNPVAWVGDSQLQIDFKIDKDTFPGFNPNASVTTGAKYYGTNNLNQPFTWNTGPGTELVPIGDYNASCSTYCHGNWSQDGSNRTPIWVGSGQAVCGTCHAATGTEPPTLGSHPKHAGTTGAGLGIPCAKCHATFSSYTGSAHINGNVEWDMSAYPGSAYRGANAGSTNQLAPSASYGSCTNLYCHSNVQGANGNGTGGPSYYATPTWGDADTATCGSCHSYPSNSGGHAQHESQEVAFDCHVCHNNGGTTTPTNHGNGVINFSFVGLGQNTQYSLGNSVTPGTAYGSCSNSDCHGRYTRTWGPATDIPRCEKCHGSRTSARGFYNTRGPNGTLSIYSSGIGTHDIHIQNLNSPRKSTFARFTSFNSGYNCNQCHNTPSSPFSAGHIDTALPAEAAFEHVSSIAHTFSAYSSPVFNSGTQVCSNVWCHGAGMASNSKRGNYANVNPTISRTNPKWDTPFLTGNSTLDCTKCHALPPPAPDASYTHWGKTLTSCNACHQHVSSDGLSFKNKALHANGKIDGGCTNCHGNPPINNIIGDANGLATPAQNALRTASAGAHNAHQLNSKISSDCYVCHYNYDPTMPSTKLEIGFNGYGGKVVTGTFNGYTNSQNGPKWQANSAPGGTTTIVKVNAAGNPNQCSNLYCHGSTLTSGTLKTPNWEGGASQADCGTCHGADISSVPTPALSGAHTRHASNSVGGLQLVCTSCHGESALSKNHVDGNVYWELDRSLAVIGATARYRSMSSGSTGQLAPSASYGNCTNIYCHSNVTGTNGPGKGLPTSYKTVAWGSSTALTCGSCHADMATDAANATGSHKAHAIDDGYACGVCHHDGGRNTETHADGYIFVNITSSLKGVGQYTGKGRVAGSAAGYGSCSNVICHGAAVLTWGADLGTKRCQKCHGSKTATDAFALGNYSAPQIAPGYGTDGQATDGTTAATARRVGAHQRHLVSNAITARVKCTECHVKVDGITASNHLNYTTATLTFSGRATGNGHTTAAATRNGTGVVTCSNLWCHTGKYNSGTSQTPAWTNTNLVNETGTTVADCTACHAMPPSGYANHPPALGNMSSISSVSRKCASCHNNLSSSATNVSNAFVDTSKHVNGVIEVTETCNACHDYDTSGGTWGTATNKNYGGTTAIEGRGAHYKHIEYLKVRYNVTLNPNSDTYGSGAMATVCGTCHSVSTADHTTATPTNGRNINFGGSTARQFGSSAPFYNGSSANSGSGKNTSAVKPKSCSNTDCHYKTSPIWSTF